MGLMNKGTLVEMKEQQILRMNEVIGLEWAGEARLVCSGARIAA